MSIVVFVATILWANYLYRRVVLCHELVDECGYYLTAYLQVAKIADEACAIARNRSVDFMKDGDPQSADRNRLMADWFAAEADLARYKASIIRRDQTRARKSVYMIFSAIPSVGPWSPVAGSTGNPTLDKLVDHQSSFPLEVLGLQPIPQPTTTARLHHKNDDMDVSKAEIRGITDNKFESKLAYWQGLKDEAGKRAVWFVEMQQVFVNLDSNIMMKASAKTELERYRNLSDLEVEAREKYSFLVHEAIWEDARHRAYQKLLRQ